MEKEYRSYFLTEEEMSIVRDNDDAEELLESKGIEASNVEFDGDDMITYYVEPEIDPDDVERGWNENYLNSIGMSMRDFV